MQTEQLLFWSGITNTEHTTTSGSNEVVVVVSFNFFLNYYVRYIDKFFAEHGKDKVREFHEWTFVLIFSEKIVLGHDYKTKSRNESEKQKNDNLKLNYLMVRKVLCSLL